MKVIQSRGGGRQEAAPNAGGSTSENESFLSCLPALASQSVIQSIPQTEAFFIPLPLDVLYLAGVSLQLGIKNCSRNKINSILPKVKQKF